MRANRFRTQVFGTALLVDVEQTLLGRGEAGAVVTILSDLT